MARVRFSGEELLHELYYHPTKCRERDEVGDCHETIERIGHVPDRFKAAQCPEHGERKPDEPIDQAHDLTVSEQIGRAGFAIEAPGQERIVGSKNHTKRHQPRTDGPAEDSIKPAYSKHGSALAVAPDTGEHDHQRRDGAHDDRIEKYLKNPPQTLTDRVIGDGGGMGDGSTTQASLVAEHASRDPITHSCHEPYTSKAPRGSSPREGTLEDECDDFGQLPHIDYNDCQRPQQIQNTHERNAEHGDIGNAFDPTESH